MAIRTTLARADAEHPTPQQLFSETYNASQAQTSVCTIPTMATTPEASTDMDNTHEFPAGDHADDHGDHHFEEQHSQELTQRLQKKSMFQRNGMSPTHDIRSAPGSVEVSEYAGTDTDTEVFPGGGGERQSTGARAISGGRESITTRGGGRQSTDAGGMAARVTVSTAIPHWGTDTAESTGIDREMYGAFAHVSYFLTTFRFI